MEKPENSGRLWTDHFIKIMIVAFTVSIAMNMTMTTLPLYGQYIGGSKALAGFITAIFALSALLFRPFFGNLLDTKGRKKVLVIGIIIFTLSIVSYNFAYTVAILLFLRFIQGVGFSGHSTATGTIVADIVPVTRLAEGIGYFGIANTLGSAIGPTMGLYIIKYFSYNSLFIISALLGFIGFFTAFLINYEKEDDLHSVNETIVESKENNEKSSKVLDGLVIIEKTAIPTSIVLFFIALTLGSIITFLPIYALNRGIDDIGIFFIVYAFALLLTRVKMGKMVDRYGVTPVMIPGLLVAFISLIILAFAQSLSTFLIVAVLYGFGFGTVYPTLNATMVRMCPPSRHGTGNATFFSAMDIGVGLGSIIWGYVSEIGGFIYVYLGAAICIIFSLVFYLITLKKQIDKDEIYRNITNLDLTSIQE